MDKRFIEMLVDGEIPAGQGATIMFWDGLETKRPVVMRYDIQFGWLTDEERFELRQQEPRYAP